MRSGSFLFYDLQFYNNFLSSIVMQFVSHNKAILILLLLHYVFVGMVCGLFHNHEEDLVFHDNCPACQWEVQSQNADTALSDINDLLKIQIAAYAMFDTSFDTILQSQIHIEDHPSRAPPISS